MKTSKNTGYFRNNFYIFRLLWQIKKSRVAGEFFYSTLRYVYWIFYDILFLRYLVESLENGRSFEQIMRFILLSLLGFAIPNIFATWYQHVYKPKTDADIFGSVNTMLFEKATHVELECYENTEFYNRFTLAMKDCERRFTQIIENQCIIVTSMIASIFALYYMFQIDHFVILFVAGPLIGNFVFGKMINEVKFRMNKEKVPYDRKMDYVNRALYLADYAKEFRMSEAFHVMQKIYEEGFCGVMDKIREYRSKKVPLVFLRNFFTFVVIFQGVIFYSLYRVMVTHSMNLSGFTVLFSAMNTVAWMVIQSSNSIIQSYEDSLYIANLREFLEYEPVIDERQEGILPKTCEAAAANEKALEFHNVSFTYRGQEKPVLQNIDMTIRRNEKIAIVGHNGAGKTTFTKLLMRLYDVSDGEILYYGKNVKELDLPQYRKLYGTAFQDYQVFAMTVAENVLMRKPQGEEDYQKVREALSRTGIYEKICSLPHGMDTVLTKEFADDGAALSGGELQKIAVARAFAKDYQIAIFDEPSSALDPVAEYRLYENILEECRDKTVLFISHRLSTAVLADRIYLFENGEIVEQGSHESLMRQNGKYADMFQKQAQSYVGGMDYAQAE
ncbi:MAG: ABC transporter ATP-binding protein/permease [Candidatus Gastranaerophilales bacterium]|nr:ABC transporter ATP-binding protein/permease [Candidatus Gastranaerophilales bacterium]